MDEDAPLETLQAGDDIDVIWFNSFRKKGFAPAESLYEKSASTLRRFDASPCLCPVTFEI